MPNKIVIKNEKEQFLKFLKTGIIPRDFVGHKRRDFIEKAKTMKIFEEKLLVLDQGKYKVFVGRWESITAKIIIYKAHLPGHICADKLYETVSKEYCGINREMVRKYVKKCEACNMAGSLKKKDNLTYITSKKTHERLFMDIIDLSKYSDSNCGQRYILACLDSFSKFAFCFALDNKTGKNVAENLDDICAREGKWEIIHTDNGKEFCNVHFDDIIQKYNMVHVRGRPRYPQCQGQVERFNGTLKRRLAKSLYGSEKTWSLMMRDIVHQYNNTVHSATTKTPFELFRNIIITESSVEAANTITCSSETIQKIKNYQRNIYKNHESEVVLNIGDRVLLSKDFDNNTKTKKNAFDCNFYESIYRVMQLNDQKVFISNESGGEIWVDKKRIKKII